MTTMQAPNEFSQSADSTAIGLSFICAIHCLLLPVAVAVLPSATLIGLEDELFHWLLLIVVLPVSAFALMSGLRRHHNRTVLVIGVAGLMILIVGAAFGHDLFGEAGERIVTLIGSGLVALGHFRNFQLCQAPAPHPGSDGHHGMKP